MLLNCFGRLVPGLTSSHVEDTHWTTHQRKSSLSEQRSCASSLTVESWKPVRQFPVRHCTVLQCAVLHSPPSPESESCDERIETRDGRPCHGSKDAFVVVMPWRRNDATTLAGKPDLMMMMNDLLPPTRYSVIVHWLTDSEVTTLWTDKMCIL